MHQQRVPSHQMNIFISRMYASLHTRFSARFPPPVVKNGRMGLVTTPHCSHFRPPCFRCGGPSTTTPQAVVRWVMARLVALLQPPDGEREARNVGVRVRAPPPPHCLRARPLGHPRPLPLPPGWGVSSPPWPPSLPPSALTRNGHVSAASRRPPLRPPSPDPYPIPYSTRPSSAPATRARTQRRHRQPSHSSTCRRLPARSPRTPPRSVLVAEHCSPSPSRSPPHPRCLPRSAPPPSTTIALSRPGRLPHPWLALCR